MIGDPVVSVKGWFRLSREPVRRPAVPASAVILTVLSAGWIGCGYRLVGILRFSNCCGPGIMLGPGPIEFEGYVMIGGSVLTIAAAALMIRGAAWAAWTCRAIALLVALFGVSHVRTAWPGPDTYWQGRHMPWWFAALMQGWPELIAGVVVVVLLTAYPAVGRGRGSRAVGD